MIALALILFEGGLAAGFDEIRPVIRPAISLALVGTVVTAVISGLAAAWLFDFSTLEGLLLGSILAATDSAAIFALLRGSMLKRKIAAMFFTLGLLVFPSQLGDIAVKGTTLAVVVVFLARPLAAFVATAFQRFTAAERLALGWAGLRGAVPVVLATFPVIEGTPHSVEFFNIVFFAVLLSTLLQGSAFEPLARKLGLDERARVAATGRNPLDGRGVGRAAASMPRPS